MGDTPRLNFPYIVSSHILDALVQPVIEGALVNNPPANPAPGVLYVVGRSPNGAWTGKAECLAQYVNDVWTFYVPFEGLTAWNKASKSRWYYSGTEWSELSDDQHGKRTDNPHKVTVAQLGAETPSGAQAKANAVQTNLTAHINSGTHKWSSITDKPSTLKDYGIGDAYTKTEADSYQEEAKTQIGVEQGDLGVEVKGRTLVNLLGKDGNFEVDSNGDGVADEWSKGPLGAISLDTSSPRYGSKAQRIMALSSDTAANDRYVSSSKGYRVTSGKYYIYLVDFSSDGFASGSMGAFINSAWMGGTIAANNRTIIGKFAPTSDQMVQFALYNRTAAGSTGWVQFDGLRLYEITQAECNTIDSMTADQVAAKYPYVDSIQFKKDILVTQTGKNLIPAFNSGEWTLHANAVVNSAYSLTLNATANSQGSTLIIPVTPNTQYTIRLNTSGSYAIQARDSNKAFISAISQGASYTNLSPSTITTPANTAYMYIILSNHTSGAGTYTFSNLMVTMATADQTFEPQVKAYAHTPMQVAQDESVWLTPNASVYKEVWKKNVQLIGDLTWYFGADFSGSKRVYTVLRGAIKHLGSTFVKYDGSVLSSDSSVSVNNSVYLQAVSGAAHINIVDSESGWTEAMTPTPTEISAYLYGWKMCASDGSTYVSGTKYWKKITDGTGITSTLPTANYAGYTPYVLHYKLATPVYHINYLNNDPTKPVMSAGSVINIPQEAAQVEQRSGVRFRENVSPYYYSSYENYYISALSVSSKTIYRPKLFFIIYKNKVNDSLWILNNAQAAANYPTYGLVQNSCAAANYDSTATYSTTYEQLDKYLYTVDTFAVDNPVPTRQRNFALDSTEQKIAYFKVNPVSLVGAIANQSPKTLADYGILDAYTKDIVDGKLSSANPLVNAEVYHCRDIVALNRGTSPVTGTVKITLPTGSEAGLLVLSATGYEHVANASHWKATLSGQNGSNTWSRPAVTLSPNSPFSSVRFGYDSLLSRYCILLGTTSSVWAYPKITLDLLAGHQSPIKYTAGWEMTVITDETGIINMVTPTIKTLATLENPVFSGKVGIGKTPTVPLDVAGAINSDSVITALRPVSTGGAILRAQNDANVRLDLYSLGSAFTAYHTLKPNATSIYTNAELGIEVDANAPMTFWTNGSERMKIGANGNVGIGKTPTYPLDVLGGADLQVGAGSDAANGSKGLWTTEDAGATYRGFSWQYNASKGASLFVGNDAGWLERMRINPNGNVGIGTNNPQATLHSTGSTILGCVIGTSWASIGNQQMAIYADNVGLYFSWKDASGNQRTIGFNAPAAGASRTI